MRAAVALLGAAILALTAAGPAAALTADEMYEPGTVVVIDLTLPPASLAALEAEPEEYVEGTFSLAPSDGTPTGVGSFSAPLTVGIRLKGEASFRDLDGKAAFKVKFNELVKGQRFLGLRALTLNNMVQDPSMVHEALAYEAFRAAGIPAPRTGYADVRVNGERYGVHLNLETLDRVALERIFGSFEAPPQHLYEGAHRVDVVPGDVASFDVDEGEDAERPDLEALAAAAAPAPEFSERIAPFADLEEMTRMWAVERYIGHWDGYSESRPHNYYLHSDPAGVFRMLPWGTDQTWSAAQIGFGPPGPVLFDGCFDDPSCAGLYRRGLREVGVAVDGLDPGAEARRLAAILAPWQALESAPRRPFGPDVIAAEVAGVGNFATARPEALARWLGDPPADPDGQRPASGGAGGGDRMEDAVLSGGLAVNRVDLGRGLLRASLALRGSGTVRFDAEIVTAAGTVVACAVARAVAAAGALELRCRLSAAVRRHLAARWLRLRVLVVAEIPERSQAILRRVIRLPRTAG